MNGSRLKAGEGCDAAYRNVLDEVSQQGSTSRHRRGSLRNSTAAKALKRAEENRRRREAAALAAERAKEEHAKRMAQEKEEREARDAAARQSQLQLEARREREALVTEQDIVFGSSLITYGAGLDVRSVTPGFDLRQVTIRGLPPDAREEEIAHIFTQQGLDPSSFFIVHLQSRDNGNSQQAAVLMSAEEGVAIAIGLQFIEFRDHFLIFEVGEKAGRNTMRSNSDFLTVYDSASPNPLLYTIVIPMQQYKAQQKQWDSLSEITPDNDAHVQTQVDDGAVFIHVLGHNKRAVGSLKVRVEHMVAGERLDPKFWHPSFSAPIQRAFFDHIYRTVGVYVKPDLRTQSLKVYSGSDAMVEEARRMVKEEVDRLVELETTEFLNPASIWFFMREGLTQLRELLGEENVIVSFRSEGCQITVKGEKEGRHQLNRLIAESLIADQILPGYTEEETCPICTDEISCAEQLGCGHSYCSQCLQHYLESAPHTKIFPLACIGDEGACKVPISIPEIRRFLQPQVFKALVEVAFRTYLDQHTRELKFCTTPDCQQIYRLRPNATSSTLQCPSCFSTICSACNEEAHEGMTCEERRIHKDPAEQDRLFNEWVARNGGKRCPRCRSVIEKTDGCNHITCRCGTHFCWKCEMTFDPRDIYQHMDAVHGGAWAADDVVMPVEPQTVAVNHGPRAAAPIQYDDNVPGGCCIVV